MPYRLGKLPDISAIEQRKPLIWIHALSVGEVNAVMPLIERVRRRWPGAGMLCTASTATGIAALKQRIHYDGLVISGMPLDLFPITSRVLNHIVPDCFILCETDIWPGFIWSLKKRGVPAILVNGSISQRASERLGMITQAGIDAVGLLYGGFHKVAMQSAHDVERLTQAAGSGTIDVICTGNMKFDVQPPVPDSNRRALLMKELAISEEDFVIVAGSTHEGEEQLMIELFLRLTNLHISGHDQLPFPLRMIMAPRDPRRSAGIVELVREKGVSACLKSTGCTSESPVVIVDTLGELAEIYSVGHAAFVGGTMVPVGGHNLLEPAAHGVPVFWGPFTESCRDMAELLQSGGGGLQVNSVAELANRLAEIADRGERWRNMGNMAAKLVKIHRGAADRCLALVGKAIAKDA
jgi:3-deoxy-D-manno-octulosonic-acid transferase